MIDNQARLTQVLLMTITHQDGRDNGNEAFSGATAYKERVRMLHVKRDTG